MMKNTTYFLILLLCSCAIRPEKDETFIQTYETLDFNPSEITQTTKSGLSIMILPIDAKSTDIETEKAARQDGNYEKEFVFQLSEGSDCSYSTDDEFYRLRKKNTDLVDKLVRRREMPLEVGYLFKRRINCGREEGKDGFEIESLAEYKNFNSLFNPYFINETHLSVFEITLENKTNELVKVGVDNFQVLCDGQLFTPYKTNFFEKDLIEDIAKINNVFRFNMPNELLITPSQKVSKYISIPALNINKEEVIIQYIENGEYLNFTFGMEGKSFDIAHNFINFRLSANSSSSSTTHFYVIDYENGAQFSTKGNSVYVDKKRQDEIVSIYGIAVDEISEKISFGKAEKVKFSDFENRLIRLKLNEIK